MSDTRMPDLTVGSYVEMLAGSDPAPGGGSAAALAGALAAASGEMVGNFTVGKKKYADVESEIREHMSAIGDIRAELIEITHADVEAYSIVRDAYGLPKRGDIIKAARDELIQTALRGAAEVPLELARCTHRLSTHLPPLAAKGNRNLISDVGVAARLCQAAFDCARLNVEVNLALLDDVEFAMRAGTELRVMGEAVRATCERVFADVMAAVTRKQD